MMATSSTKRAGHQFVGVGVGAIILNAKGKVFLAKRGQEASNDQGLWGWPGGEVEFGETLTMAIQRELREEHRLFVEIGAPIGLLKSPRSSGPFDCCSDSQRMTKGSGIGSSEVLIQTDFERV